MTDKFDECKECIHFEKTPTCEHCDSGEMFEYAERSLMFDGESTEDFEFPIDMEEDLQDYE